MTPTSSDGPNSQEVEKRITDVLNATFPNADERIVRHSVVALIDAPYWSIDFHHHGKDDADALLDLGNAIRSFECALTGLSSASKKCLSEKTWQRQLCGEPVLSSGDGFRVPVTIEEIRLSLAVWSHGANDAILALEAGRPRGKAIWEAVPLVEQARFTWDFHREPPLRKAPAKGLNPASKFGSFLQDVLDALGIKMEAVSAFNSWRRERQRPDSIIGVRKEES